MWLCVARACMCKCGVPKTLQCVWTCVPRTSRWYYTDNACRVHHTVVKILRNFKHHASSAFVRRQTHKLHKHQTSKHQTNNPNQMYSYIRCSKYKDCVYMRKHLNECRLYLSWMTPQHPKNDVDGDCETNRGMNWQNHRFFNSYSDRLGEQVVVCVGIMCNHV